MLEDFKTPLAIATSVSSSLGQSLALVRQNSLCGPHPEGVRTKNLSRATRPD